MSDITSSQTIAKLKIIFATHGLPKKIVTDNGFSFVSQEFKEFMLQNGILHITSAPYHIPQMDLQNVRFKPLNKD